MARSINLIIKESPIHGCGVFANRDYSQHEVILVWLGNYKYTTLVNHSCAPTCYTEEPDKTTFNFDRLVAGPEGVATGQEITFDYRKTRWEDREWKARVYGRCGCLKCRKTPEKDKTAAAEAAACKDCSS